MTPGSAMSCLVSAADHYIVCFLTSLWALYDSSFYHSLISSLHWRYLISVRILRPCFQLTNIIKCSKSLVRCFETDLLLLLSAPMYMVRLARELRSVGICSFLKGSVVVIHVEWENFYLIRPLWIMYLQIILEVKEKGWSEFKRGLLWVIAVQVILLGILV